MASKKNDKSGSGKRRRGRPRKNPDLTAGNGLPKRKRGRPRKEPEETKAASPKRKRGRPRKNPVDVPASQAPKKRGRPRKNPIIPLLEEKSESKRRGRPPKSLLSLHGLLRTPMENTENTPDNKPEIPAASPATSEDTTVPSAALSIRAVDLQELRMKEMAAALEHELLELQRRLPIIIGKIHDELQNRAAHTQDALTKKLKRAENFGDPEIVSFTDTVEKLARRLASFRLSENIDLEDLELLRRRLQKTTKKLRR